MMHQKTGCLSGQPEQRQDLSSNVFRVSQSSVKICRPTFNPVAFRERLNLVGIATYNNDVRHQHRTIR